jgi:hypothetical protein
MAQTFRFDADAREELASRFDAATVRDLTNLVQSYRDTLAHVDPTRRARMARQIAKIRRRAERLREAIREAELSIQAQLRKFSADLDAVIAVAAMPHGRPVLSRRHKLEFAVGHALHQHGVKLTTGENAGLAIALGHVLRAAGERELEDIVRIATRVRKTVLEEAKQTAELNAVFDAFTTQ